MKLFSSYKAAKASGMMFAGLNKAGHIEATDDAGELISWLMERQFTPFEASLVVEDFRL